MLRGILYITLCAVVLCIIFPDKSFSQENENSGVNIMFYNVENLFDTYDDSVKNDEEFLPGGIRGWTSTRYYKKLNSIFQTIAAAGEWNPPEIIGFSEIENRKVLEDLIYGTYLSRYNYGIVHNDSPDIRGIDAALIFRKETVSILDSRLWIPEGYTKENFASRSVLYVKCVIQNDTIHILVNHWPSRIGGELAKEGLRTDIAEMVRNKVDSISFANNGRAKIIIMGDFNCTWADSEIGVLTEMKSNQKNNIDSRLINLSEKTAKRGLGSYRYQGIWEMIDQIIVSDYLLNGSNGLYTNEDNFKVFNAGFLLKDDPKYPGKTPFSTYYGYKYQGGYSDHLPVLLELMKK